MGVLGAIGVTYDDYISVDDVVTSEHYSMAEIAAGSVVIDNAHTSDGNDKCGLQEDLADSDSGDSMGSGLPVEVCCPSMWHGQQHGRPSAREIPGVDKWTKETGLVLNFLGVERKVWRNTQLQVDTSLIHLGALLTVAVFLAVTFFSARPWKTSMGLECKLGLLALRFLKLVPAFVLFRVGYS